MKLIHCSFDIVDDFTPRVPTSRVKHDGKDYEDATTPRICVAPTILQCLKAMPKAGEIIRWMRAVGLKPIIHAYYLKSDNVHVCTTDEVMDADITNEMWILDKPTDWHRIDYEIESCAMNDCQDIFGKDVVAIHGVSLKRAPYTDSLKDLIDGLGLEYAEFMSRFPYLKFRELAVNVECTDELLEKREKNIRHRAYESLKIKVEKYKRINNANGS